MLTPYLPYPLLTGGQTRSYNLIKRLSKLGHDITLFSLVKSDKEKKYVYELEKYCKEVRVFKRPGKPWTLTNIFKTGFSLFPFLVVRNWADGEKSAVGEKLKKENFDLIHAETFYVMPHIPETNIPIVLVDQTIEYKVYQHYVENYKFPLLKPLFYLDVAKLKTRYSENTLKVPEKYLKEAIRLNPNFAEPRCFLADIYFRSCKIDEALVHAKEALRIKPDYQDAQVLLSSLEKFEGKSSEERKKTCEDSQFFQKLSNLNRDVSLGRHIRKLNEIRNTLKYTRR